MGKNESKTIKTIKRGYNDFMFKEGTISKIVAKLKNGEKLTDEEVDIISKEYEEGGIKRLENFEAVLAQNISMKAEEEESEDEKVENIKKKKFSFFSRDDEEEVEEAVLPKYINLNYYFDEEVPYNCTMIEKNQVLNNKMESFEVKGNSLLDMDLEKNPIFVERDGDYLRVKRIVEVEKENPDMKHAYIMLETRTQNFVIEFKIKRIFD